MKKIIKLSLLSAVVSAILALPVAASAETPSRIEFLSVTLQNNVFFQAPIIFEHNPPGDRELPVYHNPPGDRELSVYHNPPGD